jgi:CheY-specific phosphatase CheX
MQPHELAEIIRNSTHSVFSTMLGTELSPLPALDDPAPFKQSEVIGFIGMAGDFAGYVSIHVSRQQATDFTARLVGVDVGEVTSEEEIRDAVGELTNMLAGNVKTALSTMGMVEIALPTVVMTPKADLRVRGARGVAVPFEDYTGVFHVEVVLSDGGEPAPLDKR